MINDIINDDDLDAPAVQMMMILILSFLVPLSVAAKPAYPRQTCLNVFNSLGKLAENLDVANITVADLEKVRDITVL